MNHPIEHRDNGLYIESISAAEIAKDSEIWSTRWQKGAFNAMPAFIERELAE